jgi:hypothetical protein
MCNVSRTKIIQFDLIHEIDKMYRGPIIEIIVYIPDTYTVNSHKL